MEQKQFKETVLLVDANYLDNVQGGFKAFLRDKVGHDLPAADLATWIIDMVMGVLWDATEQAEKTDFSQQETQVVFVCEKNETELRHFLPARLREEVDGMAFSEEQFGEFLMSVVEDEHLVEGEPLLVESAEMLLTSQHVKHLIVVPDPEKGLESLRRLQQENTNCHMEIITMEPDPSHGGISLLGYALLHSLGLSPDQL